MKRLFERFVRSEPAQSARSRSAPRPGKWDKHFREWIDQARSAGKDPNDLGDEAWANDYLDHALPRFYLPYVHKDGVIMELGPGSGRVTRHLIGRCKRLELVDNSDFVIEWIQGYLKGKCDFRTHLAKVPHVPEVENASVDFILAHGVVEHLDFDETAFFLDEFNRVLRPGGHVSFNYNSLHGSAGEEWFRKHQRTPGHRCIFRFYVPEFIHRLGEMSGFRVHESVASDSRLAHVVFVKPQ